LLLQLASRLPIFWRHLTEIGEYESTFLPVNASMIQGSGIGPVCYIFNASDFKPFNRTNIILKYADDTYLTTHDANSLPRGRGKCPIIVLLHWGYMSGGGNVCRSPGECPGGNVWILPNTS